MLTHWKLETQNSILHIFSFLHKLSFENNFCFLFILGCQISFLISKIENCFWKQKIGEKTVTKHTLSLKKKINKDVFFFNGFLLAYLVKYFVVK